LLQLGFVAPLCLAADDAEESLTTACRFSSLWSRLPFHCEQTGHDLIVAASAEHDPSMLLNYDVVNAVLIWMAVAAASSSADVGPSAVHAPCRFRPALRRVVGCPIYDQETQVRVVFLRAELKQANAAADPALFRVLVAHGERRLREQMEAQTTSARVQQLFERLADQADLNAERLGRELGFGVRTLHRRLRAEGTSLRKLLAEFQMQRCLRELELASTSAKQIAFSLGFADPASFHRAFKRWTGRTVNEYRAAVAQASGSAQVGPR
jgi:AraC-like DNA-binding protein